MKITFFEVEPWQKEYLKKKLKGHQLRFVSDELTLKNLSKAKNSEAIVVFIYSVIDKEILDKLSNLKYISLVKKGAYLINTARGGLIETKALISALDKGIIAGVALDVLEEEEDLKEDRHLSKRKLSAYENKIMKQNLKLLKDRDVLITPHSAFYTREAQQRILDVTVENIFGKGKAI